MSDNFGGPCCAHRRVSYRTEEASPGHVVADWWECDSGCGKRFQPQPAAPSPAPTQEEPHTPDETLAAQVEEIAMKMRDSEWTELDESDDLLDAAKRLRELAGDMRFLEETHCEIGRSRNERVVYVRQADGTMLGFWGATYAAAIADARQQLAQGGAND